MSKEESPVPDKVLKSAKEQLDQEGISLADNEEILHALSELTPVYENDRSYFVLGNYDRKPIRRLNLIVDRLNRRDDAYAFRMVDIRGEWDNSIQKFCLISDLVTYLVGVAEKDPSDFLVEQGLLVGTVEYFSKSYVLKREYEGEERPFGWMQNGVFELSKSKDDCIGGKLKRISSKLPRNFRNLDRNENANKRTTFRFLRFLGV